MAPALWGAAVIAAAARVFGAADRLQVVLDGAYWHTLAPGVRLVELRESRYQLLALGEREGQFTLYLNGMQAVSFPEPFEVNMRAHFLMNQHRQPAQVLVVGRGLEGMIQRMLDYPVRRVTLVSLDPAYAGLVEPRLPPAERHALADPRLALVSADAADFLAATPERFDLIVLLTPPPATAANNRYYTREFFARCRSRLAAGGVLAVGLDSGENVIAGDLERAVGTVYQTLRREFPRVLAAPGTRLTWPRTRSARPPWIPPGWPGASRAADWPAATGSRPIIFGSSTAGGRVAWLRGVLARSEPAWENTERQPVSHLLNTRVWDPGHRRASARLAGCRGGAEHHPAGGDRPGGSARVAGDPHRFLTDRRAARWPAAAVRRSACSCSASWAWGWRSSCCTASRTSLVMLSMLGSARQRACYAGPGRRRLVDGPPDELARRSHGPLEPFLLLPGAGMALCVTVAIVIAGRSAATLAGIVVTMLSAGVLTGLYFPLACRRSPAHRQRWPDASAALRPPGRAGRRPDGLLFLPALGDLQTLSFSVPDAAGVVLLARPRGGWR